MEWNSEERNIQDDLEMPRFKGLETVQQNHAAKDNTGWRGIVCGLCSVETEWLLNQ